ncbi:recombinase family protein [Paenisporosarcina sp. OV554]|uniref:recombinase family protein n=1 Tax=Paenisporosarcina sp. OV554 TaxID=2135694 RepID=UPI000D33AEF7|nr:recombinase family protein [Paenisporosarcina sp. OV554]PUB15229.1 resolvase-like protein [Paenisporosarcina sp. OV554]
MSKIAYIRVSSEKQNTARQRKALKEAGCELFYDRPELQRMLSEILEGDIASCEILQNDIG